MTMAEEGFFKRWSRRKIEVEHGQEPAPEPTTEPTHEPAPEPASATEPAPVAAFTRAGVDAYVPAPAPVCARAPAPAREAEPAPPPTMADVALLTPESDFSAFVRQDVDADVRRTALKKLFADPHFNTMDRLDVYIDDYNKPSPMSDAMLASLRHAKSVFRHLEKDEEADTVDGADAIAAADAIVTQAQPQPQPEAQPQAEPEQTALAAPPTQDPPAPQPGAYLQHPPETETR